MEGRPGRWRIREIERRYGDQLTDIAETLGAVPPLRHRQRHRRPQRLPDHHAFLSEMEEHWFGIAH